MLRAFVQFDASDEITYVPSCRAVCFIRFLICQTFSHFCLRFISRQVQKRILYIAALTVRVALRQHGLAHALIWVLCPPIPSICAADMVSPMPNLNPLSLTRSAFFSWGGVLWRSTWSTATLSTTICDRNKWNFHGVLLTIFSDPHWLDIHH